MIDDVPLFRRSAFRFLGSVALIACTRDFDSLSGTEDAGALDATVDGDRTGGDGDVRDGGGGSGDAGIDACTACTGGPSCTIVCAPGCPCAPRDCSEATCSFSCEQGATPCAVSSSATSGAQTNVTCKSGSTCSATCEAPPCNVVCEPGAQCQLTCHNAGGGDACNIDCQGGTTNTSCSGSGGAARLACRAACPP